MFRRSRPDKSSTGPASQGAALRAMALGLKPEELGLSQVADRRVWSVVMDTGLADGGWHSLVALADGTTSLYTSAAFGIIGAGAHEAVRLASEALLATAEQHLALFAPDADNSTPSEGMVTIRALTFAGRAAVTAMQDELGYGHHPASPVFHAAHGVIAQMRQIAS